jgi:hypothetical protein
MKTNEPMGGRSDVARLLGIDEWYLANFSNTKRYPYNLGPTAKPEKGRGKKALYGRDDIFKIALAHRMLIVGLKGEVIASILHALFPKGTDLRSICVEQRAKEIEDLRFLVVDFSRAPSAEKSKFPEHWRENKSNALKWVRLIKWKDLQSPFAAGNIHTLQNLRTVFVMPFDELLAEVDARLLGKAYRIEDFFVVPPPSGENGKGGNNGR